jgi:hypothetical protein
MDKGNNKSNEKMSFLSFCTSIKQKFISFKNKLFKSKKVDDSNKFNKNSDNSETRTERLLHSIMTRLDAIEIHLSKLIEEKNKEIEESFDKAFYTNKRYKVM